LKKHSLKLNDIELWAVCTGLEKLLADLYNDDTIDSREIIEIIRGLVPRLTKMLEDSELGRMFLEERSKIDKKKGNGQTTK